MARTPSGPGRRRGAYSQTERVLELLARLGARRAATRLEVLAAEVEVSEKQLRRDLAILEGAGHRLERTKVEGRAAVRLARGGTAAIALTLRERFALVAMRDVFASLAGTPLAEDAGAIFRKVVATLPDDAVQELTALGPRFAYVPADGVKDYAAHADVVDELLTGALRRQPVDADYRPAQGEVRRGGFEPWGIALYRHGLYAVGRWDDDTHPRVFAVERFTHALRRRGARFELPGEFSLSSFFAGAFGVFAGGEPETVRLDFDAGVTALVRARRFHPSQTIRRRAGGGLRMVLTLPVTPDVVSWLVGWGPMVRVCEPAWLGARVAAEHEAALAGTPASFRGDEPRGEGELASPTRAGREPMSSGRPRSSRR